MNPLLAQVNIGDVPLDGSLTLSSKYQDFSQLVTLILRNGLTLAGIILLVLIVAGGISFIAAAGSTDQKKMAQAQATITSALVGFLVIFCSYFIIQIIEVITGLKIL